MNHEEFAAVFTPETLTELLPPERSNQFFEALFGDAAEGAYDVSLVFISFEPSDGIGTLHFELHLRERPGKCLSCSLTYGLPQVFRRHPILNLNGLVRDVERLLNGKFRCGDWNLSATRTVSRSLHTIPLTIEVAAV